MAKKEDLATKSESELEKLTLDLKSQIRKLALEMQLHRVKDVNAVKKLKIQLARVLTVLREKELVSLNK